MVLLFHSFYDNMTIKASHITEIDLKDATAWGETTQMGQELILTDKIDSAVLSQRMIRFNFILMALCCKGEARYRIDKRKQEVKAGDLFFMSQRHIIDDFTATPDFECQCIMVSPNFYHDFVQDVKNVSSLLIFSMNFPVVQLTTKEKEVYGHFYQVIREKMTDTHHYYRTQLVKALLLAMFYDMSNVIYRVGEHDYLYGVYPSVGEALSHPTPCLLVCAAAGHYPQAPDRHGYQCQQALAELMD